MSLFKTEFRRILFLSEETYELQFPKPASVQIEEEELQADHAELRAQQESLHMEMNQLRQEKQMLERERGSYYKIKNNFKCIFMSKWNRWKRRVCNFKRTTRNSI